MASGHPKPVPSLEQEIDSMPLVDEDAADEVTDEESSRVTAARPLSSSTPIVNGCRAQIPPETAVESMPSSGVGSPSREIACKLNV